MNKYQTKLSNELTTIVCRHFDEADDRVPEAVADLLEYVQEETRQSFINGLRRQDKGQGRPSKTSR